MNSRIRAALVAGFAVLAAQAACAAGKPDATVDGAVQALSAKSGPGAPAAKAPPQSPGGLWVGSISTGLSIVGMITEAGAFTFAETDGVQYTGTATVSKSKIKSGITGRTLWGTAFQDGSTSGTGKLKGSVAERSHINASARFKTAGGNGGKASLSLSYSTLYEHPSSLEIIAGNYQDAQSGVALNINSNGVIFAQSPNSGCVVNGQVSILNTAYNLYRVQYSLSNCAGSFASLNGMASGYGFIDPTTVPNQLFVFLTGSNYSMASQFYEN